jgi:outer membrane beta-barrel protein
MGELQRLISITFSALVLAAPLSLASVASAQDMTFELDEVEKPKAKASKSTKRKGKKGAAPAQADQKPEGEVAPAAEADATAEAGVIGELAAEETTLDTDFKATGLKEAKEEIYAVQQIYALRLNRLELAPSIAFTVNDPYVSHPGIGAALNYWWTNVLAVGVNFLWYQGLEDESDLNFHVRRSTRLGVPITEYQFGAHLNFTYVPLYGKFAMFNEHIFQWDAYVLGGVGLMRTRPVPVVDPEYRNFDFDFRLAFNLGLGIRVFITRYLAIFGELRDYAYLEQFENLNVPLDTAARQDPDTWLSDSSTLTNNVTVQLGVTFFFPFSFNYELPR